VHGNAVYKALGPLVAQPLYATCDPQTREVPSCWSHGLEHIAAWTSAGSSTAGPSTTGRVAVADVPTTSVLVLVVVDIEEDQR